MVLDGTGEQVQAGGGEWSDAGGCGAQVHPAGLESDINMCDILTHTALLGPPHGISCPITNTLPASSIQVSTES